jgi:hypothetical protein
MGVFSRYKWSKPGVDARFSAPVKTGPEGHPASYTMGTGSFPGVNRPGRGVDHPSSSRAEVKERVQLYLPLTLWAFVACCSVTFTFTRNFTFLESDETVLTWATTNVPPHYTLFGPLRTKLVTSFLLTTSVAVTFNYAHKITKCHFMQQTACVLHNP